MANRVRTSYAAECFWPGVRDDDLSDADRRVRDCVLVVGPESGPVRYLGWRLAIDDEVVWFEFEGPIATVRRVADQAEIPLGRILRVARGPDPADKETPT